MENIIKAYRELAEELKDAADQVAIFEARISARVHDLAAAISAVSEGKQPTYDKETV